MITVVVCLFVFLDAGSCDGKMVAGFHPRFGDIEDIGCGRQEPILADHSQGQREQLKLTGLFLSSLKVSSCSPQQDFPCRKQ